jgi:signal transduction histidine kinase
MNELISPGLTPAARSIDELVARARAAQKIANGYDQDRVDQLVAAAGWAIVEPTRNRELAELAVADTGIGIHADHLSTLFQDFVQVAAPIQKRLRGTGLGLSLSRKLALLLGGDVAVESSLGEGSRFSVTIPLQLPVAEASAGATGAPASTA